MYRCLATRCSSGKSARRNALWLRYQSIWIFKFLVSSHTRLKAEELPKCGRSQKVWWCVYSVPCSWIWDNLSASAVLFGTPESKGFRKEAPFQTHCQEYTRSGIERQHPNDELPFYSYFLTADWETGHLKGILGDSCDFSRPHHGRLWETRVQAYEACLRPTDKVFIYSTCTTCIFLVERKSSILWDQIYNWKGTQAVF